MVQEPGQARDVTRKRRRVRQDGASGSEYEDSDLLHVPGVADSEHASALNVSGSHPPGRHFGGVRSSQESQEEEEGS